MWFFRRSYSLEEAEGLRGFTDYHSHILPGVDDGVQTLDEALRILDTYAAQGIKEVWLTPHIMEDIPNTTEYLRTCFARLQAVYTGPIILHLAAENMLDNLFAARLETKDLLPLGEKGDALLVETSYMNPPVNFREILLRIKAKGYYPIMAHPERYVYLNSTDYQSLKQTGVLFQLNLFSLNNVYGKEVKERAEWLLKNNMYDLIGSDIHSYAFLLRNIKQKTFNKSVLQKLSRLKGNTL